MFKSVGLERDLYEGCIAYVLRSPLTTFVPLLQERNVSNCFFFSQNPVKFRRKFCCLFTLLHSQFRLRLVIHLWCLKLAVKVFGQRKPSWSYIFRLQNIIIFQWISEDRIVTFSKLMSGQHLFPLFNFYHNCRHKNNIFQHENSDNLSLSHFSAKESVDRSWLW